MGVPLKGCLVSGIEQGLKGLRVQSLGVVRAERM